MSIPADRAHRIAVVVDLVAHANEPVFIGCDWRYLAEHLTNRADPPPRDHARAEAR